MHVIANRDRGPLSMVKNCELAAVQSGGRCAVSHFAHAHPIMLSIPLVLYNRLFCPQVTPAVGANVAGRIGVESIQLSQHFQLT